MTDSAANKVSGCRACESLEPSLRDAAHRQAMQFGGAHGPCQHCQALPGQAHHPACPATRQMQETVRQAEIRAVAVARAESEQGARLADEGGSAAEDSTVPSPNDGQPIEAFHSNGRASGMGSTTNSTTIGEPEQDSTTTLEKPAQTIAESIVADIAAEPPPRKFREVAIDEPGVNPNRDFDWGPCKRCGHNWRSISARCPKPKTCPGCKSAYWDRPRKIKITHRRKAAQAAYAAQVRGAELESIAHLELLSPEERRLRAQPSASPLLPPPPRRSE